MNLSRRISLEPDLPDHLLVLFHQACTELAALGPESGRTAFEAVVGDLLREAGRDRDLAALEASVRVASDLRLQGWRLEVDGGSVTASSSTPALQDDELQRDRVRALEQLKRDEDLQKDSIRAFIRKMERQRHTAQGFRSIVDLMAEGADLARELAAPGQECPIAPYVQPAEPGSSCEHTGLDLWDIWRYFRMTWSNPHASVPGRSMAFLVRDSRRPNHPVIGLFALSSAVVQIRLRDEALRWHPDTVVDELAAGGDPELFRALVASIDRGVRDTWTRDFLLEGVLSQRLLATPTIDLVDRLRLLASEERQKHDRSPAGLLSKAPPTDDEGWRARAETTLFRSKRALLLADLLEARRAVLPVDAASCDSIREFSRLVDGRRVLKRLARRVKAEKVGTALADLSVCGALAPYNHVLGGKLVAMLAASPAAVRAYQSRYSGSASEIASSMAGRALVKSPALSFIGTTSLYGVTPNQYTRAGYPATIVGGTGRVHYRRLGMTEAYGSSQFSQATVRAIAATASHRDEFTRVNSIFGEGASPKMRKLRGGLDLLDLPSDELLQHHRRRVLYGVELLSNSRRYLLGMDTDPVYSFPLDDPGGATRSIAQFWWERWAASRLTGRLDRVSSETTTRPLRHGARVCLPEGDDEPQVSLFDDLGF